MKAFDPLLAAIVTFTRIPVSRALDAQAFALASLQLPLLGWLIGGLQFGILALASLVVHPDVALLLALIFPIALSGGMHEDGLADFADGMFCEVPIERRFEIMKDPRVGSFGVLTLLIILGGGFLFLQHTQVHQRGLILLTTAVFSRSLCIPLLATLPYKQQPGSRSQGFLPTDFKGWKTLLPLWPLVPALVLFPWAVLPVFLVFLWLKRTLRNKLGGLTGDCLGAGIKFAEFLCFLLAAGLWSY